MKKWEDIPVEELRDVCRKLYDGIWGDDKLLESPIKLDNGKTTDDVVKKTLKNIHMNRIARVVKHQSESIDHDVLLLGISKEEKLQMSLAIKTSITDYMRPLADMIGLWDEDDEGVLEDPETVLSQPKEEANEGTSDSEEHRGGETPEH